MKCARTICDREAYATHVNTGEHYCVQCARQINDACGSRIVTWEEGPLADERALIARIQATPLDRVELDLAFEAHAQLKPHPIKGSHVQGCHCRCEAAIAYYTRGRVIDAHERANIATMSPLQLLEYLINGEGADVLHEACEPQYTQIKARFAQLKKG